MKGERGEWRRFKWKGGGYEGRRRRRRRKRKRMWWALVGEAPSSLLAVFYYLHCRDVEDFFLSFFSLHLSPQINQGPTLLSPFLHSRTSTPPHTNHLHFNFNPSTPAPFPIPPPTKFSKIINIKRKCLFIFNNQTQEWTLCLFTFSSLLGSVCVNCNATRFQISDFRERGREKWEAKKLQPLHK